jgi:hypothetical protein
VRLGEDGVVGVGRVELTHELRHPTGDEAKAEDGGSLSTSTSTPIRACSRGRLRERERDG